MKEREREICLEKEGERQRVAEGRRGGKESKSNESKYNMKGYLIVSTLYPRLG